ncbi:hypothetical protein KFK09_000444 [Dendrobium nobile]|uniref:RNase H type-1 domain-containing protein n=1 Tax=Dendrobium nobile TaxID=94219 RepID=A0A8T3CB44_DENNO|nr:hypothetical protein KFK09_000444 [Dendrobium nobile]
MNHHKVIHNVKYKVLAFFSVKLLSGKNFKNYSFVGSALGLNLDDGYIIKEAIIIYWIKPPTNFYKLNVDGISLDSTKGYGGVIKDSNGILIMAFVGHYRMVMFFMLPPCLFSIV